MCKSTFCFSRLSLVINKCQCWVQLLGILTNKVICEVAMNVAVKTPANYEHRK